MATIDPPTFSHVIDPADYTPFILAFSRGDGPRDVLGEDEGITSFAMAPTPASVSAGFQVSAESGRGPVLEDNRIGFWLRFDPSANASPAFAAPGTVMGVEVTLNTNLGRIIQRTAYIRAGQR